LIVAFTEIECILRLRDILPAQAATGPAACAQRTGPVAPNHHPSPRGADTEPPLLPLPPLCAGCCGL